MLHRPDCRNCMCKECYERDRFKCTTEASIKFPDCPDCNIHYNYLIGEYDEYLCNLHKTPEEKAEDVRLHSKIKSPVKSEEVPSRWYFITYTEHESVKDPTRVLKSAQRCIKSKAVGAIQWAYSLELTQSGTPHVHIRLNTEKYPDYKKCIGAFNDGFRYDVQMEKGGSAKYLIKEESKPSKAWLAQWGLDDWWHKSSNYSGELPVDKNLEAELISHV